MTATHPLPTAAVDSSSGKNQKINNPTERIWRADIEEFEDLLDKLAIRNDGGYVMPATQRRVFTFTHTKTHTLT